MILLKKNLTEKSRIHKDINSKFVIYVLHKCELGWFIERTSEHIRKLRNFFFRFPKILIQGALHFKK